MIFVTEQMWGVEASENAIYEEHSRGGSDKFMDHWSWSRVLVLKCLHPLAAFAAGIGSQSLADRGEQRSSSGWCSLARPLTQQG